MRISGKHSSKNSLTRLFVEFCRSEQMSGAVIIASTVVSMMIANSIFGEGYLAFWQRDLAVGAGAFRTSHSIQHWINDGLMAVFFLLIALEIEREIYVGEISSLGKAALPAVAALGGMAAPALIYFLVNLGADSQAGIGIPVATDIAFSLGILSLLGNRVPVFLKVFLTAMAIMDDLGAIVVIALFYTSGISLPNLLAALGVFALLLVLNRLGVRRLAFYLAPGLLMWHFMYMSGIHATVAGVLLAFAIPFGTGEEDSPSWKLQHFLHRPVAFIVLPLFAFANTGIVLDAGVAASLLSTNSLGIFAGLVFGKPLGIVLFTMAAVRIGLGQLPYGTSWRDIAGIGFLAGIGFTMSIFITLLAFDDAAMIAGSKGSIFISSLAAGAVGFALLRRRAEAPEAAAVAMAAENVSCPTATHVIMEAKIQPE